MKSPMKYFNDDKQLPVYSQLSSGYCLSDLVDILMSNDIDSNKVCTVQPLGVNINCAFIVDLDLVDPDDLKADDNGSWKNNGTRRIFFVVNERNKPEFLASAPVLQQGYYYCVVRRYFVHRTYGKFRRCIVEIKGKLNVNMERIELSHRNTV